jgi:hypothetical protein
MLVFTLAAAYGYTTGRRATLTWNEHRQRYTGALWDLIQALLPQTVAHAGKKFAPATEAGCGRKISRTLAVLANMDLIPRHRLFRKLDDMLDMTVGGWAAMWAVRLTLKDAPWRESGLPKKIWTNMDKNSR